MCGIAGARVPSVAQARRLVETMCDHMRPRGPDGGGVVTFDHPGGALAIGSRRLAIIDPSPDGDQPMSDRERGTTIVYNGMVYNFRELRERLVAAGETFSSNCDTEVVLKAYSHFGESCVDHLRGMYAFAIWDDQRGRLFLARDPLGIKPLYYTHRGNDFLFASQVKTLLASGAVAPTLSTAGIGTFLAAGAVTEPLTAIEGVHALPAGHTATFEDGTLRVERRWQPPTERNDVATVADAASELRPLLEDAVRTHLVSDAPLGVFLSGGIDSSVIAGLASREHPRVRTVSVTFDEEKLSEERYIGLVAERIGSEHVDVRLRPSDLLPWLDDAFTAMDQPTVDGINTYVVSRAAAGTGLKVAVSGLGADELFDGYGHVNRVKRLELLRSLPPAVTRGLAHTARLARGSRQVKLAAWTSGDFERGSSYELLRALFVPGEVRALLRNGHVAAARRPGSIDSRGDVARAVSILDLTNYLRNVLLRDTDAMGMSQSLEVRVPFLDQPLVEWALRLPAGARGRQKEVLVAAARDVLPPELHSRPKQGFVLPLAAWMQNELRAEVGAAITNLPPPLAALVDTEWATNVWRTFLENGRGWHRPWGLYALSRWVASTQGAPAPDPVASSALS